MQRGVDQRPICPSICSRMMSAWPAHWLVGIAESADDLVARSRSGITPGA
jgi:hypothetical protein